MVNIYQHEISDFSLLESLLKMNSETEKLLKISWNIGSGFSLDSTFNDRFFSFVSEDI